MANLGPILTVIPTAGRGREIIQLKLPFGGPAVFNRQGASHQIVFVPENQFYSAGFAAYGFRAQFQIIDAYTLHVTVPPVGSTNPAIEMPPGQYIIAMASGIDRAHTSTPFTALSGASIVSTPPSSVSLFPTSISVGGFSGGSFHGQVSINAPGASGLLAGYPVTNSINYQTVAHTSLVNFPAMMPPPDETLRQLHNDVEPLVDGEEAFASIEGDISRAINNICIATWWVSDDFLLTRNPNKTLAQFCKTALQQNPELRIYLLIWEFVDLFSWIDGPHNYVTTFPLMDKDKFCDPATEDRFFLAYHGNGIIGSHHQKFVLTDIDGKDASLHCMGFNYDNKYWDKANHPYPPYPFPELEQSWHDTGVRVRGPVIEHFEKEFNRRWFNATGEHLNFPKFDASPKGRTVAVAQIKQERLDPNDQNDIKEWYLDKIKNANNYIYLENQYFDDIDITNALIKRYLQLEKLGRKIPITIILPFPDDINPVLEWATVCNVLKMRVMTAEKWKVSWTPTIRVRPAGGWGYVDVPRVTAANTAFSFLRETPIVGRNPSQTYKWKKITEVMGGIRVYCMVMPNSKKPWVYVHSKLAMIDDHYSIGSCNIAEQSFLTDSEANVSVVGYEDILRLVQKLWPPLIGNNTAPGNFRDWFIKFEEIALNNRRSFQTSPNSAPQGLLFPFPYEDDY